MRRRLLLAAIMVIAVLLLLPVVLLLRRRSVPSADPEPPTVRYSVEDRLKQVGQRARARMFPFFQRAGLPYPPKEVTLLTLKEERELQVYVLHLGAWHQVLNFEILGASGGPGPKLREGDYQVPEGIYKIESLNPNSAFHLSLRVNYPSPEDWEQARLDGREMPGSDIMIHGGNASVGCVAIGDPAIEQLFTLVADAGIENIRVLILPWDLRLRQQPYTDLAWMHRRYEDLLKMVNELPAPGD